MASPARSSQAFLIRKTRYSESDRVLSFFSREFGRVSAFAKGAADSRRRFGTGLEPLVLLEAEFQIPPHGGLAFLKSARPLRAFPGLLQDVDRLNAAYRFLELVEAMEPEQHPAPTLFEALLGGFLSLEGGMPPAQARLLYEGRLLHWAGLAPRFDACLSCQRKAPFDPAFFEEALGGLVCGRCQPPGRRAPVSPGCQDLLRGLFSGSGLLQGPALEEADAVLEGFLQHQLGRELKTALFQKKMVSASPNPLEGRARD